MFKFSKSKFAKATSAVVTVMTVALMLGPVTASAAALTAGQIQSILSLLQSFGADTATINNVSASLNGQPTTPVAPSTSGYQFNTDLTLGSKGADVVALQQALVAGGYLTMPAGVAMGYFGALTQTAVAKWQVAKGIAPAAGYVGPKSRAALNGAAAPVVPGTPTPVAGSVSAALASDSPVASTLIAGQSVGTLAKFVLSNGNSGAVKVTSVKLKRTGVSADVTIPNVYLYNGNSRLTDSASVSQGSVNFNDNAGIVMIPAMSSVTLSIKADIASGSNGQTVGVMLTDVMTDATGATTGLPVSASQHNIAAAPAGMTTVDVPSATVLPATASVDPQTDFVVWQRTITVGNREADLKLARFRQIGSVLPGDLANFRLQIDGVQVGTAVAALDSMGYVNFDLSAAPKRLMTGNRVVKVLADIISGSNRNFTLSLRQAGDLEVSDSQLNVTILPTVASASFSNQDSGQQNINQGNLTITKETDSPSGNLTLQASGVTLAKYKFKAQGEKLKVENLRVAFAHSNGGSTAASQVGKLRNGAIFANGIQIGSTADINEDSLTPVYTQFNLGSSLVVEPGKDVTIEVRGDVYDNDGTNNMVANDTFTVSIAAGSTNVQRLVSLNYLSNAAVAGNSLTVATGAATLSKYTAMANQTVTVPQTAYKIGEYRLQSGATEDVNVNTLSLDVAGTVTTAHVTDVYVTYGSKTTPVKSTVSATGNTWSVNELVTKNTTLEVKVYASISQAAAVGSTTISKLTVDGTGVNSGNTVTTGQVTGQQITVGTGSLTVTTDASTPISSLVVGGALPKVASFKLTGSNDAFTVTELYASTTANGSDVIGSLIWKDGATTVATTPFSGAFATSTGLSLSVPANQAKVIDAYLQLGTVGTPGAAATGLNVQLGLLGLKYRNSNGVETVATSSANIGNQTYVYKSKPTISNVALPGSTLSATTLTVAKFTISADSAGTIAWRKLTLNISSSTPSGSFNVGNYNIYDSANESTPLSNVTVSGGSTTTVTFLSSQDQEVSGSKTYVVKATVVGAGAGQTGATLSHSIATGQTAYAAPVAYTSVPGGVATFVWSDESETPHSASAASWSGDFLVKNIPTDSQTLTK